MKEDLMKAACEPANVEIEITGEQFQKIKAGKGGVVKKVGEENLEVVIGTPAYFNELTNERLRLIMQGIKNEMEQTKLTNAELGLAYKIAKYVESLLLHN